MPTVDNLDIQISTSLKNTDKQLDILMKRLSALNSSLLKINGSSISGLANGVSRLSSSMERISTIKTSEFSRLARNLTKIGSLDVSSINSVSSSVNHLTRGLNQLGEVSDNATKIGEFAKNIAKLGNANIEKAIENIPKLANSFLQLTKTLSKAPNVSQNIIDLSNSLANLSSQGSKVGTVANSLTKTEKTAKNTTKSIKGLASAFGKFYATYFGVIRGIKTLYKSIESTADYVEAFNYFEVSFNKIAKEWKQDYEKFGYENAEEYAESFGKRAKESLSKLSGLKIEVGEDGKGILTESGMKNLGLNIQEITQYASQLASVTNSLGQSGEISLRTSNAFTKLAGDISSLFNQDYSAVAKNLQSGLIGQSRALYKYGIDITNATLQTYAYNMGIEKNVSEMTQAEKMQLRMIAILEQSKVSWGDLANTIDSPSNMIRQFKNNLKEAGLVLGQLFIPLLQKVLPVVNGVTIAIKRLLTNIAEFLGIKLDLESFGQSGGDFDDLSESLDDVSESAKDAKKGLRGFDELKTISSGSDSSSISNTIDLTNEIIKATSEYEKVWQEAYDKMEQRAQNFADSISKYFKPVEKLFKDISIGDWFAVGEDVSNIVTGIFDYFTRAIESVNWYGLGNNIGLFLAGLDWTGILGSLGNLFWTALNAVIDLWKSSFDAAPIETGIITAVALLSWTGLGGAIWKGMKNSILSGTLFKNLGTLLSGGLLAETGIFSKISNVFALTAGGAGTLGESFTAVFGASLGPILAVLGAVTALAVGLATVYSKNEEVRKGFSDSISSIKDGLQPTFEFFANTVIPNLNSGWERMKDILSPFANFLNSMFTSIWMDMINPALSFVGEQVLPKLTQAFENLWKKVLVPLGRLIGDVLTPVVEIISDVLNNLWKNIVVPLAGALGNVLGKAFDNLVDTFNYVIDGIEPVINVFQFLWNNVLSPIVNYLKNTLKPVFETVFKTIGGIISGLGTTLGGVITFITGVFTENWKKAWNGVVDVFKGVFNGIISIIEGVLNLGITGINKFLKKFEGVADIVETVSGKNVSVPQIKKISIPRYEVGGFPKSADLFWANENGIPELVGTMGGKTAVASGMEITGIKDAVLTASAEEKTLLRELISAVKSGAVILMDRREIGRAVQRENLDYFNRTGSGLLEL